MKKICITIISLLAIFSALQAQENDKVSFSLGADFVSSYVWRGAYQTGFSVQPSMSVEAYGFSFSAWGNTDIADKGFKEVDFTLGYTIADFSIAITDYWWMGEGHKRYFKYKNKETDHLFEGTIAYILPLKKLPLSLSWNTMFAGADYKADGNRAYSTYIELSYPFAIKDIDLDVSLSITPWESLYANDFTVINVGVGASKTLKITDSFSMPVFGKVMANPESEDIFFVFGISVGF